AAAYRQGKLKTALSLYAKQDDIASVYDRGNVLVKLGRFQKGLEAYNEVLARDPGNRDAAYNKAQVLKLLKAIERQQHPKRSRHSSKNSQGTKRQKTMGHQNATKSKTQSRRTQSNRSA